RQTAPLDAAARAAHIAVIEQAPARIRSLVAGITEAQLATSYRSGGWTVRQIVHHIPDSHMNAYVRMKLAATEESPTVKTYDEAKWAELPEARTAPVEVSLALVDALHRRWVGILSCCRRANRRRGCAARPACIPSRCSCRRASSSRGRCAGWSRPTRSCRVSRITASAKRCISRTRTAMASRCTAIGLATC